MIECVWRQVNIHKIFKIANWSVVRFVLYLSYIIRCNCRHGIFGLRTRKFLILNVEL